MIRKTISLLLACLLVVTLLSACEPKKDTEMTAVTLETAEVTEASKAAEATDATEATEAQKYAPVQTTAPPTAAPTEAPTESEPLSEETQAASEASRGTEVQTEPPVDSRTLAVNCIGCSVATLYSVIGYPPNGSSYTASIFGSGEDGELYYDGFTVCTYRDNGIETVIDVD